jgi:hypothetical protein
MAPGDPVRPGDPAPEEQLVELRTAIVVEARYLGIEDRIAGTQ